jgi:hypothetical protein
MKLVKTLTDVIFYAKCQTDGQMFGVLYFVQKNKDNSFSRRQNDAY